jgi:hypothetical protein
MAEVWCDKTLPDDPYYLAAVRQLTGSRVGREFTAELIVGGRVE